MGSPKSRKFQHVRELDGELVIVDDACDVAHRLTTDAARVWRACDGHADTAQIAAVAGVEEAAAQDILVRLEALGLLEEPRADGLATRRAMLRRSVLTGVGVGVGLPVISSIVLPTAAQAFSSQGMGPRQTPPPSDQNGGTSTPGQTPGSTPGSGSPGGAVHHTRTGAVRGARSSSPTSTLGAGRSGQPGGSRVASAGGGATGRRVSSGTLPFTGSRLVQSVAAGTGLIAVGVTTRRVAMRHAPR